MVVREPVMEITSQISNSVSVINRSSLNIEDEISVGNHPNWIYFTQGGKYFWVRNTSSNDVSVIDIEKKKVIETIPVGEKPKRIIVGTVKTQ